MNTRYIVFVLALFLAVATATEWSVKDDELFSDVLPETPEVVAEPSPVVQPIQDYNYPEYDHEEYHYVLPRRVARRRVRQPQVVVAVPNTGFVPVAPVAPIEESLKDVYIRARSSAITANKQAQAVADANATAATAQSQAQTALTPQAQREAALNQTRVAAAASMANTNATIPELESQLTKLRDVAGSYRQRLAKNAEELKNTVSAAEATRLAALQSLAEKETQERDRRRQAREAAERARALRRKASAEARRRAHENQVREIFSEAKNRTQAAIKAANIAHYEAQLAETRKSIRELKLRVLREKAIKLAKQRAELEKQLNDARTSTDKITSELQRINAQAARASQSVTTAAAALQDLLHRPSDGVVHAPLPKYAYGAPAVPAAPVVPAAPAATLGFYQTQTPQGFQIPQIIGGAYDPSVPVTVPVGSLAPVNIVSPYEVTMAGSNIFIDNPAPNATSTSAATAATAPVAAPAAPASAPAATAGAAAPIVNQSQKANQIAQTASFIEFGFAEADLSLVRSNLDAVQDAVNVARQQEDRILRALNDPRMAEQEFNAVFDAAVEMF